MGANAVSRRRAIVVQVASLLLVGFVLAQTGRPSGVIRSEDSNSIDIIALPAMGSRGRERGAMHRISKRWDVLPRSHRPVVYEPTDRCRALSRHQRGKTP